MLIHTSTEIPLSSQNIGEALCEFASFVNKKLKAGPESEFSISLSEPGCRANALVARAVPDDSQGFSISRLPIGPTLTARDFLKSAAANKPKKSHSQLRVKAVTVENPMKLLENMAGVLPESGRGVLLIVNLPGWKLDDDTVVEATFSRFQHNGVHMSAALSLSFPALSLKDPLVSKTITAASVRLGLRFEKPVSSMAQRSQAAAPTSGLPDERLLPPTSSELLVMLLTFDEVLARAAEQIDARTGDLESVPLLFSRSKGFDKRMEDMLAGKKGTVNFPSVLKHFMKASFPEYAFDSSDPEQLWFRRSLSPTLDVLLLFEKLHQWGMGKTFSLRFAVDFPNTRFGGAHTGFGGTRQSIFWMFHQAWEEHVWAYTTAEELAVALESCRAIMQRVLPALESHSRDLLMPPPADLIAEIAHQGALSAREAYELVLPMARNWSQDVQVESIGISTRLQWRDDAPLSISQNGRLGLGGSWTFKFISKSLDQYCWYTVPHTGRIWWDFYHVPQNAYPKYSAVLESDDWIDSTAVVPRATQLIEQLAGERKRHTSFALRDVRRYSGNFMWEANAITYGKTMSDRSDIAVRFDAFTGEFIDREIYTR